MQDQSSNIVHSPAGWSKARLRFKARVNPKSSIDLEPTAEVSFLPMDAIGDDGSLRLDETRILSEVSQGYTYFEDDDVSIAKITPCFENGKGAVMDGLVGGAGFGTTELIVLRPESDVSPKFLYYVTQSDHFRSPGEAAMLGSGGQKRVPDLFVKDFATPWPSRETQIAIATYLDAETKRIDGLIQDKRSLVGTIEELRGVTITQAVTRGLTPNVPVRAVDMGWLSEMPRHWQAVAIKRLVSSMTYGGSSSTLEEGAIRVLTMAHINQGKVSTSSNQYWTSVDDDLILDRNDLLFNRTNSPALVGKVGIFLGSRDEQISFASYLVRLRASDELDPRWLNYALNCHQFIEFARGHALVSLNQANLNSSRYGRFVIAVPPKHEQTEIADFLDAELVRIEALKAHLESEIGVLSELRSATITDAVLGRIDVREHMKN